MTIKAGNFIIGKKAETVIIDKYVDIKIESSASIPMENGTVIHNGQQKKFNKKMSTYMIDMLTSEE